MKRFPDAANALESLLLVEERRVKDDIDERSYHSGMEDEEEVDDGGVNGSGTAPTNVKKRLRARFAVFSTCEEEYDVETSNRFVYLE